MKIARAIPILSGTAALAIMTAAPALAGPAQPATGSHRNIRSILRTGSIVTGVRGSGGRDVVLTGTYLAGGASSAFLWRGPLSRAGGAAVSVLRPAFRGVTGATFYGPDTHLFNPRAIPRGDVRAVGSYVSSDAPSGVHDQGMIYLGPVSGRGGRWASIAVPAHGRHVTGHVSACPPRRPKCVVMDTIAHSTMGHLVVGNYDLKPDRARRPGIGERLYLQRQHPAVHAAAAARQPVHQELRSTASGRTAARAARGTRWPAAHRRTAASAAFLINYNERTGRFGRPFFFTYANRAVPTHFDGITAVPGGFNLVAITLGHGPAMAHIRALRHGGFGRARWWPVPVASSALCPCRVVTGNTVWRNRVMGLYVNTSAPAARSYLAVIAGR